MWIRLATLAVVLSLAGGGPAQEQKLVPPPFFKMLDSADKAKGEIAWIDEDLGARPVQKQVTEFVDGVPVQKTVTEYVWNKGTRRTVVDLTSSRVITPDGKQVALDDAWKRLNKGSVVLISYDPTTPPAQAYLDTLKEGTLIVMLPAVSKEKIGAPRKEPIAPPKKQP